MTRIIVVGGGWAGTAAALSAKKAGAESVVLLERTDMLLGTGLVGGIFRNNGRFTVAEEMIAMGAGDLFHLMDKASRHSNINFPGHKHASLYDVSLMEPMVKRYLLEQGVEIRTIARVTDLTHSNGTIQSVIISNSRSESFNPGITSVVTSTWQAFAAAAMVFITSASPPRTTLL